MDESRTPAVDATKKAMRELIATSVRNVRERMRQADDESHEAMVAFAAGKFEEFWKKKYEDAQRAVQDEYDRIVSESEDGQATDGGDGEEGS